MLQQQQASSPAEDLPAKPAQRRDDIQGLRAVAVLTVVLFHARLPVPGGFLGVDVFFVISGYVITGMLWRERQRTGRIAFGAFYLRRFKRLTPALALMVTLTIVASALVLSPLGPQQVAASTGIGALALAANLVIAWTTGGYFDPSAETNPLLNTWSLSVEEQFYLAFPLLLWLAWRTVRGGAVRRHMDIGVVAVVAALSLGLALLPAGTVSFPGSTFLLGFYSPVTRAWEFAAGALLALAILRGGLRAPRFGGTLGGLGLALVIGSVLLITSADRIPGPLLVVPVIGTVLVLWAGTGGHGIATRALSTRPMVVVGDLSYSIYLWHWPFIVLATVVWPTTVWIAPVAALASLVPAVASYRWVENPIRRARLQPGWRTVQAVTVTVLVPILTCVAVWGIARTYWLPRVQAGEVPGARPGDVGIDPRAAHLRANYYPCSIDQQPDMYQTDITCLQSKPDGPIDVAILGDSHAHHLFTGLAESLPDKNVLVAYLHYWPTRDTPNAQQTFRQIAERDDVSTVIVNAYWKVQDPSADPSSELAALTSAGKQVFLLDDVPDFPFDSSACKFRTGFLVGTRQCSVARSEYESDVSQTQQIVQGIAESVPEAQLLSTFSYLCNEDACSMDRNGVLLYEDTNHLNLDGSRYFAQRLLAENPALGTAVDGAVSSSE